jgi:rhamnopyranosyl-N-acetylglucosaminyl-diphospho-decaprenol beta-1,3/1,4-galactofuranosyltransferase
MTSTPAPSLQNLAPVQARPRVCAVVVTFNRPLLLRRCLEALRAQTRMVDTVLVVDNASTDNTREMLLSEFSWCELMLLPSNEGGSGGFHAGVKAAFEQGYEWIWLMDDDGAPAPDCLEALFAANRGEDDEARGGTVLVPVQRDSTGLFYGFAFWRFGEVQITPQILELHESGAKDTFSVVPRRRAPVFRFVGPLLSRRVIERVGLPRADYFIWFDDIEFALRVYKRGKTQVRFVPGALFHHDFRAVVREVTRWGKTRVRPFQPSWKLYYLARNQLYSLRKNHHPLGDFVHFLFPNQLRGMIGELLFDPDGRERAGMRLRGLRDGMLGRMGRQVDP